MRRLDYLALLTLLPWLGLAGCDGDGGGGPPPPVPTLSISAGFPKGGLVDVIEVNAVDRLPLRNAELVAPGGATTPASTIEANPAPTFAAGQYVANDSFHSGLAGGGNPALLATPDSDAGTALRSQSQLLATVSAASIPLPDPVAYRRDWRGYHIRLGFGAPGGAVETRELPAPEPPPAQ